MNAGMYSGGDERFLRGHHQTKTSKLALVGFFGVDSQQLFPLLFVVSEHAQQHVMEGFFKIFKSEAFIFFFKLKENSA